MRSGIRSANAPLVDIVCSNSSSLSKLIISSLKRAHLYSPGLLYRDTGLEYDIDNLRSLRLYGTDRYLGLKALRDEKKLRSFNEIASDFRHTRFKINNPSDFIWAWTEKEINEMDGSIGLIAVYRGEGLISAQKIKREFTVNHPFLYIFKKPKVKKMSLHAICKIAS